MSLLAMRLIRCDTRPERQHLWALFALIAAALLAAPQVVESTGTPVFYATIARQLHDDGRWLPVTYFGYPYVNKPPLLFWLTRVSIDLFGPTDAAAGLPARVLAVITIGLVGATAARTRGRTAAILAMLTVATCSDYIENSVKLRMESGLACGYMLAAFGLTLGPVPARAACMVAGTWLAALIKGPPGFLVPLLLVPGLWQAWRDRRLADGWGWWIPAFILAAAPALYGVYLTYRWPPEAFTTLRTDTALAPVDDLAGHLLNLAEVYLYDPLAHWLPWSLAAPPALWYWWCRTRVQRRRAAALETGVLVLVLLTIAGLVFKAKTSIRYLVPLVPLASLIIAHYLAALVHGRLPRWLLRPLPALAGAGAVAALVLTLVLPPSWDRAAFHRHLDARLPAGAPLTVALGPDRPDPPPRREFPERDWPAFHLDRAVTIIPVAEVARTAPPGSLCFCRGRSAVDILQRERGARVLARGKRAYLLELGPGR